MLADMRHSKDWEEWWGPAIAIEPAEFEEVWRTVEASPVWPLQLGSERMFRLGETPVWLPGE